MRSLTALKNSASDHSPGTDTPARRLLLSTSRVRAPSEKGRRTRSCQPPRHRCRSPTRSTRKGEEHDRNRASTEAPVTPRAVYRGKQGSARAFTWQQSLHYPALRDQTTPTSGRSDYQAVRTAHGHRWSASTSIPSPTCRNSTPLPRTLHQTPHPPPPPTHPPQEKKEKKETPPPGGRALAQLRECYMPSGLTRSTPLRSRDRLRHRSGPPLRGDEVAHRLGFVTTPTRIAAPTHNEGEWATPRQPHRRRHFAGPLEGWSDDYTPACVSPSTAT